MNQVEDKFIHKQFPWVREDIARLLADEDNEKLIQYLRDQGIEVRP